MIHLRISTVGLIMAAGFFAVAQAAAPASAQAAAAAVPSPTAAAAQSAPYSAVEAEKILVVGEQPGPGMWMVANGDKVLWIIGTQAPMPAKITWRAKGVEAVVAKSQEILGEPSASISASKIGFLGALTMLPGALEAKNNPDDATLADVLPRPLYARWQVLRDKYIDEARNPDNTVDRMRPMFAAETLYARATAKAGLDAASPVWPAVSAAAKKYNVKVRQVAFKVEIDNARAALKEFNATRLEDVECFAKTLDRIETDLEAMRARANAWAVGDVNALKSLVAVQQRAACEAAIGNARSLKMLGGQDLPAQMQAAWLQAAEDALARNSVTLAVLSVDKLLRADGYLAKLKAKGYAVLEPAE